MNDETLMDILKKYYNFDRDIDIIEEYGKSSSYASSESFNVTKENIKEVIESIMGEMTYEKKAEPEPEDFISEKEMKI